MTFPKTKQGMDSQEDLWAFKSVLHATLCGMCVGEKGEKWTWKCNTYPKSSKHCHIGVYFIKKWKEVWK